jgi:prepilin-type N-terminal cleavage/methylation domain-containing protein
VAVGRQSWEMKRGFTLLETVVSISIFSVALMVLGLALTSSRNLLAETTGSSNASQELRKVYLALEEDIRASAYSETETGVSIVGPGSGISGDAFWFLSAKDPATGISARASNGRPLWQRNILYYTAVPTNHAALYGYDCTGGANSDGYDVQCPHKVLIRKVIDSGGVTTPTDEATQESLLAPSAIATHLTAPAGFLVPLSGASEEEAKVVAPAVLTFRVAKAPVSATWPDELSFSLQATSLQELGKGVAVGTTDLESAPQTESMEFSIFPENR